MVRQENLYRALHWLGYAGVRTGLSPRPTTTRQLWDFVRYEWPPPVPPTPAVAPHQLWLFVPYQWPLPPPPICAPDEAPAPPVLAIAPPLLDPVPPDTLPPPPPPSQQSLGTAVAVIFEQFWQHPKELFDYVWVVVLEYLFGYSLS
jgi:hypothetical protein